MIFNSLRINNYRAYYGESIFQECNFLIINICFPINSLVTLKLQ